MAGDAGITALRPFSLPQVVLPVIDAVALNSLAAIAQQCVQFLEDIFHDHRLWYWCFSNALVLELR